MEEWRLLEDVGFGGCYEVSNYGRIRTVPHDVRYSDGRTRSVPRHIKAQRISKRGYRMINIKYFGKLKTFKVHRLVAETFIPNPNNYPEVNHKDEDKSNNSVGNLEWCTHQFNSAYGTRGKRIGEKISVLQKGRKHSEETKRKIALAQIGKKHTEEWKKNYSLKIREVWARKKESK